MRPKVKRLPIAFAICLAWASSSSAEFDVSVAAQNLLSSLSESQKTQMTYPLEGSERTDWHFVPKQDRKGLPLKAMTPEQVHLVNMLLNESLGQAGFSKASHTLRGQYRRNLP